MGGKVQGVVANASNGTVFYTITNHYLKIESQTVTKDTSIIYEIEVEGKAQK